MEVQRKIRNLPAPFLFPFFSPETMMAVEHYPLGSSLTAVPGISIQFPRVETDLGSNFMSVEKV
jgi:hypothetical protein